MNPTRSNRTLFFMVIIMVIVALLVVANVLFTMVTQKHFRSGVNVKAFKDADISNTRVVKASRGTIYDRNNDVIGQDEDTYTLIAYISPTRKGIKNKPAYVQDLRKTARLLAPKLKSDEQTIYTILANAKKKGQYQTEFGSIGKDLNNVVKESIESLGLPGLGFERSVKRNYPNGVFASHLIGYAQYDEKKNALVGEMGLESTLDPYLAGKDGLEVYQKAVDGTQLPGTMYTKKYAKDGNDVYLTLDRNVQLTLQSSLQKTVERSGNLGWGIVMEVDTGKILGYASYPSFDLNNRDTLNDQAQDIPSQFTYEPGSVMKGITYSAALNSGVYPYGKTFLSNIFYYNVDANGKIYRTNSQEGPFPPIRDALGEQHNTITFDEGFALSSNIGICEMLTKYLNPEVYKEYINKFGFLKPVGIPFVKNQKGNLQWQYASDKLATGFGQSITVNALQMVQAYSAILDGGKMMRPYVVDRIVDSTSNKIVKQYEPKVAGEPITKKTSDYMRGLMKSVVTDPEGTGHAYRMDDVQVIAKTGTGQIATKNGYSDSDYTSSVMLAAPYDHPKVMVYYCFQGGDLINFDRGPIKDVMRAALVATNVTSTNADANKAKTYKDWKEYTMPSLVNHSLDYAKEKLQNTTVGQVVIGNGHRIMKQYPAGGTPIVSNQNIFLLTDGASMTMPNMSSWTKKDLTAFWELTGISVKMNGTGMVYNQNVATGTTIDKDTQIIVKMK